jgi:hypothetical protein
MLVDTDLCKKCYQQRYSNGEKMLRDHLKCGIVVCKAPAGSTTVRTKDFPESCPYYLEQLMSLNRI